MRVWVKRSRKHLHFPNKVGFDEIKNLNMLILSCGLVKFETLWGRKKKQLPISEM